MVSPVPAEVALGGLAPDERRWILEFRGRLQVLLGTRLRDLRLFGSKARGEDHDESDIDLLVLIDDADTPTRWQITDAAHAISPWLAPVIVDYDRYHAPINRAGAFYEELRRESVRL